jgi:hypothetical protein
VQRYEEFAEVIKASQGKRRYSTLRYPRFELRSSDIYLITKKTDRLDLSSTKADTSINSVDLGK